MRKLSSLLSIESILMCRIKDDTVPYPSSAIDTIDHFTEWQEQGIEVESDSDGIMTSWARNEELRRPVKKGWGSRIGNLPPVLKYRFPYNYVRPLLRIRMRWWADGRLSCC
jgi:hypothetical protein